MCLIVDANGFGVGEDTHVSVLICMLQGDNDDTLKWPFEDTITVSLLNQLADRNHHTVDIWSSCDDIPESCSGHVKDGKRSNSWGYAKFFSHKDLTYAVDGSTQFLKDDTLFFRVDNIGPCMSADEGMMQDVPEGMMQYVPVRMVQMDGLSSESGFD